MATKGARTTYSDVHARFQAEVKGSEGASADTATAIAGRTYRLLSGVSQQTAKTYADSKLQEQVAKIQTLFAQYGPQAAENASRIHNDTLVGLNTALSKIGIGIEKSEGPAQELKPSAALTEIKTAYLNSCEFTEFTGLTIDMPARLKHGAIQTLLRLEIAKTAVIIEEFFSGLDNKTIQLETAEVLDNVLKEMGMQLKKVNLPALREAQVVTPPVVTTKGLDAGICPSFNLLRKAADKLMQSDQVTYLDKQVIEQVLDPIIKVVKHCIDEDSDLFDAAKIDEDIGGATEEAKAYVRLTVEGKSTKQELTAQIQQDAKTLNRYAEHFNHPIGLIGDLIKGYAATLTIHDGDEEGLARFDLGTGQYYEITLANKHAQLTRIISEHIQKIFTEYTNQGTENFDFDKFFAENPQEKNQPLFALIDHLKNQATAFSIAPTKSALIGLCDLPFKKAFLVSQKADQPLQTLKKNSPSFMSRHGGKLATLATMATAGAVAYATGGLQLLLAAL